MWDGFPAAEARLGGVKKKKKKPMEKGPGGRKFSGKGKKKREEKEIPGGICLDN